MAPGEILQPVIESGWNSGFRNSLSKESSLWWRTRKWWIQTIVWLAISNGFLALVLWVIPAAAPDDSSTLQGFEALQMFVMTQGAFASIGVMILSQGLIVNEKRFGTAAWVMSNPVSRSAFIMAKLVGHGISMFVIVVLLPSLTAYFQVSLHSHSAQPVLPFVAAILFLCLYLLFYFTFALMLGTILNTTGPVIGISIGLMIGINILKSALGGLAPKFVQLLPETVLAVAGEVVNTKALPSGWSWPIITSAILSLAFLSLAIQRFRREEF